MSFLEAIKQRRSYYNLSHSLPVSEEMLIKTVKEVTELVPDAMNMKSQNVIVVLGEKHKAFWDMVYDTFEGKVPREKIDSFKNGAGTILFYVNHEASAPFKEKFPTYADRFDGWNLQANGMLQFSIWTALRELGLGASLQHYNPIIDNNVKEMLSVKGDVTLLAQMVFGKIESEPAVKEKENIEQRVNVVR